MKSAPSNKLSRTTFGIFARLAGATLLLCNLRGMAEASSTSASTRISNQIRQELLPFDTPSERAFALGEYLCSTKARRGLGLELGSKLYKAGPPLVERGNGRSFLVRPNGPQEDPLTLRGNIKDLDKDPVLAPLNGIEKTIVEDFFGQHARGGNDGEHVDIDNNNGIKIDFHIKNSVLSSVSVICGSQE